MDPWDTSSLRGAECGYMGSIIIKGGHYVETWEPSSFRGYRVCGDWTEWILVIIDGGGSLHAAIDGFTIKNDKKLVTK